MEFTAEASQESPTGPPAHSSPLPIRVVRTLLSPGQLFEELRREPRALGALALGAASVCLANAAVPAELWEQVIESRLLSAGQDLPDDLSGAARMARWVASIGSLVFWPILNLLIAGVFSLVFRLGLGYEGAFRQYLAVTAHAMLVGALGAFLLLPLRIFARDPQMMLTVAAFLPDMGEGLLGRTLRHLDLFNLWALGLIGLGASILDGSRSALSSVFFALGTTALIALVLGAAIP